MDEVNMDSSVISAKGQQIRELYNVLVPKPAVISSLVEGVKIYRATESTPREPKAYGATLVFLAQGQKRIFLGDKSFLLNPSNYLLLSVPLPVECEVIASPSTPTLGLSVYLTSESIAQILQSSDEDYAATDYVPSGIHTAKMTEPIVDTFLRLLQTMTSTKDASILGPIILKELLYRVAYGEHGESLRAMAYQNRRFFMIARVLDKIHESFSDDLNINTLAIYAGMSVSTFHASFKAITNSSPLQYIKNVRLHKAKALMTHDGMNAITAALRVGYESPSQFSREYKRFFGTTPARDAGFVMSQGIS
ncbi:AraC family transcriptional regulator [Leptospira perdikensis]|uniref:AraC family transcriptional regulator n=1 Tax=Leptospira perdikensis TaxID=2484948 RepID=A0A4V3JPF2_9LEPT|nr:AraC family transcriptional regulator [Leptospira perdikensis]TGL44289.1 AraC family transcriptional regulator [Leptospira perdikensis]